MIPPGDNYNFQAARDFSSAAATSDETNSSNN